CVRVQRVVLFDAATRVDVYGHLDSLAATAAAAAKSPCASATRSAGPSAGGRRARGRAGCRLRWDAIARLTDWRPERPTHSVHLQGGVAAVEVDAPAFDVRRLRIGKVRPREDVVGERHDVVVELPGDRELAEHALGVGIRVRVEAD